MKKPKPPPLSILLKNAPVEVMCMFLGFAGSIGAVAYAKYNQQRRLKYPEQYMDPLPPED